MSLFDILPDGLLARLVGDADTKEIRRTSRRLRVAHNATVTHMKIKRRDHDTARPEAASLTTTVVSCPNLRSISIGSISPEFDCLSLGDTALRAMHGPALAGRLQDLSFVCLGVSEDDVASLADAIRPFCGLRKFKGCHMNWGVSRSLLASLGGGREMPCMTEIDIGYCDLTLSGAALSVLARMPWLEVLKLDSCSLSREGARAISHASTTLRSLSLFVVDGGHEALAVSVNSLLTRLTSLRLSMPCLGIVSLLLGTAITKLVLGTDIDEDEEMQSWPDAVFDDLAGMTRLTCLCLRHDAVDYPRLAVALGSLTRLTKLKIMWGPLTPSSAAVLAPAIGLLSGLRTLKLMGMYNPPSKSIAELARAHALGQLTGLQTLSIVSGGIGPDGAAELASALEKMSGLTAVSLGGNHIGPSGLGAIAPSLAALPGLVCLDLRDNNLAGYGRHAALRAAMLALTRLTRLDLSGNLDRGQMAELSDELMRAIPTLKSKPT